MEASNVSLRPFLLGENGRAHLEYGCRLLNLRARSAPNVCLRGMVGSFLGRRAGLALSSVAG